MRNIRVWVVVAGVLIAVAGVVFALSPVTLRNSAGEQFLHCGMVLERNPHPACDDAITEQGKRALSMLAVGIAAVISAGAVRVPTRTQP